VQTDCQVASQGRVESTDQDLLPKRADQPGKSRLHGVARRRLISRLLVFVAVIEIRHQDP
jgi:hypothetical protein